MSPEPSLLGCGNRVPPNQHSKCRTEATCPTAHLLHLSEIITNSVSINNGITSRNYTCVKEKNFKLQVKIPKLKIVYILIGNRHKYFISEEITAGEIFLSGIARLAGPDGVGGNSCVMPRVFPVNMARHGRPSASQMWFGAVTTASRRAAI